MASRSGRNMTWAARVNGRIVLANSDICLICGHGGARSVGHIVSAKDWPRGPDGKHLPGLDDIENLAPNHGTMGNRALNRCPDCHRLCNQSWGSRPVVSPRSRRW